MPAAARRPSGVAATALGLAVVLGLGGCGSSSGGHSASSATGGTPKAQVISRGDAICKARNDRLDALVQPAGQDPKALANYLRNGTSIAEQATNQITDLGPPDRDAPVLASYLDTQRQQLARVRQIADRIDHGDVKGGTAALDAPDPLGDKLKADAKTFGFTVCAD